MNMDIDTMPSASAERQIFQMYTRSYVYVSDKCLAHMTYDLVFASHSEVNEYVRRLKLSLARPLTKPQKFWCTYEHWYVPLSDTDERIEQSGFNVYELDLECLGLKYGPDADMGEEYAAACDCDTTYGDCEQDCYDKRYQF